MSLRIDIQNTEDITVINLAGELNGQAFEVIRSELEKITSSKNTSNIILDVSKCDYLLSSGVRALTLTLREISAKGLKGVFCGVTEESENIIWAIGFDSFIVSYKTLNEAIEGLQEEEHP